MRGEESMSKERDGEGGTRTRGRLRMNGGIPLESERTYLLPVLSNPLPSKDASKLLPDALHALLRSSRLLHPSSNS